MLGPDAIADCEGFVPEIYRFAGFDLDDMPSMGELARAVTGLPPRFAFLAQESKLTPEGEILIRFGTSEARATWLMGHETLEWWLRRSGYRGHDREELCDTGGAMLIAPRPVFKAAIREHGHHVYELATCFHAPRAWAMLRLSEVAGRSSIYRRRAGDIVRGEPYIFPAPGQPFDRREVHPIRLDGDAWGMMAA